MSTTTVTLYPSTTPTESTPNTDWQVEYNKFKESFGRAKEEFAKLVGTKALVSGTLNSIKGGLSLNYTDAWATVLYNAITLDIANLTNDRIGVTGAAGVAVNYAVLIYLLLGGATQLWKGSATIYESVAGLETAWPLQKQDWQVNFKVIREAIADVKIELDGLIENFADAKTLVTNMKTAVDADNDSSAFWSQVSTALNTALVTNMVTAATIGKKAGVSCVASMALALWIHKGCEVMIS